MKLEINNDRKIFAIQEEFSSFFPDLKIAFHVKSNTHGGPPSKKIEKHASKTLAECRVIHKSGTITILPEMTVGELKHNFENVYGLTIDLFQKSGNNTFDETPVSEHVVLKDFNKKAE